MSLGAKLAGIDVQFVVEKNVHAAETYLRNFSPKFGLYRNDIRNLTKIKIDSRDSPVVLFGGPPCQGFSTSNQRNRDSENSNNWLFQEFIRIAKLCNPDWVVFENVRGILETENGIFSQLVSTNLESIGYKVNAKVINSVDFGIPQKRARYILVGSRHGTKFRFPSPITEFPITVNEAISDLPRLNNGASKCYRKYSTKPFSDYAKLLRGEKEGTNNNLVTLNCPLVIQRYVHVPQGGNWEHIPDNLMKNYTNKKRCHTGIYRRLESGKPSVVIGNFRKNMLIHPTQDRGLSVREAARLQSFPDWFTFRGSIGFQQQQVGNAVPPLLAKAIFQEIVTQS